MALPDIPGTYHLKQPEQNPQIFIDNFNKSVYFIFKIERSFSFTCLTFCYYYF